MMRFLSNIIMNILNGFDYLFVLPFRFLEKIITDVLNGLENFLNISFVLCNETIKQTINSFDHFFNFILTAPNKMSSYWPFVYLLSQTEKNDQTLHAYRNNDPLKLQRLINAGVDIHALNDRHHILRDAAGSRFSKIVKILVAAGVQPKIQTVRDASEDSYPEIVQCLLKALTTEQIEAEFNHHNTALRLKKSIEISQITKLQLELFTIFSKDKTLSPFTDIPIEILTLIFSKNYRTLTPTQVSDNIKLSVNNRYATNESDLSEAAPEPVAFSTYQFNPLNLLNRIKMQ